MDGEGFKDAGVLRMSDVPRSAAWNVTRLIDEKGVLQQQVSILEHQLREAREQNVRLDMARRALVVECECLKQEVACYKDGLNRVEALVDKALEDTSR